MGKQKQHKFKLISKYPHKRSDGLTWRRNKANKLIKLKDRESK